MDCVELCRWLKENEFVFNQQMTCGFEAKKRIGRTRVLVVWRDHSLYDRPAMYVGSELSHPQAVSDLNAAMAKIAATDF